MTTIFHISSMVTIEEDEGSCRVVIECDNRLGAGIMLERLRRDQSHLLIPTNFPDLIEGKFT